jgi:hypothetical protein
MRVLQVYKGSVAANISIMQLGGRLPATEKHQFIDMVVDDDPLYIPGGQHVLFLKDISGDSVHAPGRKLYRIVNPTGRYDVRDGSVSTHADLLGSFTPPATLVALEDEIAWALASR